MQGVDSMLRNAQNAFVESRMDVGCHSKGTEWRVNDLPIASESASDSL
jgi:hypothetical protein